MVRQADPGDSAHDVMTPESVVTLRAGDSEMGVAPACGGAIAFYRRRIGALHLDWLRPASAAAIAAREPDAMACFPLVPFSNRVRDGHFHFEGRDIRMPRNVPGQAHVEHGHGWQARWRVESLDFRSLTMRYRHDSDEWPWAYEAQQNFALDEDSLTIDISVQNLGDAPMPLGLGFHPYFPRRVQTRLSAQVAQMWATDDEVMPTRLVDLPDNQRLERGLIVDAVALDNGFTGWDGTARIEWPDRNAALTMTASPRLRFLVVYTPPGEPYFCVEPVSNCTDAFNLAAQGRDDTGMIVLAPGARATGTVRFTTELM
jgi:aldose 1-epimerase